VSVPQLGRNGVVLKYLRRLGGDITAPGTQSSCPLTGSPPARLSMDTPPRLGRCPEDKRPGSRAGHRGDVYPERWSSRRQNLLVLETDQ